MAEDGTTIDLPDGVEIQNFLDTQALPEATHFFHRRGF
jgi:hypothetical protein